MALTESNGDCVLGLDSGEMWPGETDAEVLCPCPLMLEDKTGLAEPFQAEEASAAEDEDHLEEEQTTEERHNCDRLSPQSELDGSEDDFATLHTIYITPLDGCQAELRSRVIKEVRKPGRSEYKPGNRISVWESVSSHLNLCVFVPRL